MSWRDAARVSKVLRVGGVTDAELDALLDNDDHDRPMVAGFDPSMFAM